MKPIEFIKNNNQAIFSHFRQGIFYYNVVKCDTTEWFQFPVPLADLGDATLNRYEKAMMLMRYIRIAIEDGTMVPISKNYE
jgi:hypothetical protein